MPKHDKKLLSIIENDTKNVRQIDPFKRVTRD